MQTVKLRRISDNKEIEVPREHAESVLIPQKKYVVIDEKFVNSKEVAAKKIEEERKELAKLPPTMNFSTEDQPAPKTKKKAKAKKKGATKKKAK